MNDFLIETNRLTIRKFHADDWKDLAEILTDKNIVYYEPYDIFTLEQCKTEAENFSRSNNFYAVTLKNENKVIGKLYFNNEGNYGTYELGYTFNAAYQGHGYAKESSAALIKYAFKNMEVRKIIAYSDSTNERSWRLLEALGMKREGELKAYTFKHRDKNDEPIWQDMLVYAIFNPSIQHKFEE